MINKLFNSIKQTLSICFWFYFVSRFEDHAALDGGADGLNVIRQILTLAPDLLSDRG